MDHVYPTTQAGRGDVIRRVESAATFSLWKGYGQPDGNEKRVNGTFVFACAACRSRECAQLRVQHGRHVVVIHEAVLS